MIAQHLPLEQVSACPSSECRTQILSGYDLQACSLKSYHLLCNIILNVIASQSFHDCLKKTSLRFCRILCRVALESPREYICKLISPSEKSEDLAAEQGEVLHIPACFLKESSVAVGQEVSYLERIHIRY